MLKGKIKIDIDHLLSECRSGLKMEKDKCNFTSEYEKGISKGRELELEHIIDRLEKLSRECSCDD